jgi:hypothetical protein
MTFFAEHGAPDFRLKRNVVVFAAMIADDGKLSRIITVACRRFFRTTLRASLRRHHIALIKSFLFFFGKKKVFFALNAGNFNIRHRFFSFFGEGILAQTKVKLTNISATDLLRLLTILIFAERGNVSFDRSAERFQIVAAFEH